MTSYARQSGASSTRPVSLSSLENYHLPNRKVVVTHFPHWKVMEGCKMDRNEAAAALAGVNGAHERLAQQIGNCPPWRHAAFGLVMATMIGTASVSLPVQMVGLVVAMALVVAIFLDDRRRYGVFINGYRRGATLPLTLSLAGLMAVMLVASVHAREAGLSLWTKAGITALTFAFATAVSVVWQRIYLRELRGGRR